MRDNDPVPRIAFGPVEAVGGSYGIKSHIQPGISGPLDKLLQRVGGKTGKLPKPRFEIEFVRGDHTDKHVILGVADGLAGGLGKARIIRQRPQQGVGVD